MSKQAVAVLAFAALALLAAAPMAQAARQLQGPAFTWSPANKFVAFGWDVKVKFLAANAVYDSKLFIYDSNGVSVTGTTPIGTNRDDKLAQVNLGKLGATLLKPKDFYFGIETSTGTKYYSKKELNSDGAEHVHVDYLSGSLVSGFTVRLAWEDRNANEPDRPEALDVQKDYNDMLVEVTGLVFK